MEWKDCSKETLDSISTGNGATCKQFTGNGGRLRWCPFTDEATVGCVHRFVPPPRKHVRVGEGSWLGKAPIVILVSGYLAFAVYLLIR